MQKAYIAQIKQFGAEVKRLREGLALTQQELSARCDIDIRTIQRIERGEHGLGLQVLIAVAIALEVTPSELLSKIKMPAANRSRR